MKNFTPSELRMHLKYNHPLMLDVREQWEWDKCHFDKAKLLPMGEIMTSLDALDKSEETVLICHHGIRSMQVARYFESIGFGSIINLRGGIDAWAKQLDDLMVQY